MKKIVFFVLLMCIAIATLPAQGIYIRGGSGYGLPIATLDIGENSTHTTDYTGDISSDVYSTESVTASYGAGANFNFGFGFKFNENFILDLNVQYLAGKKFETSSIDKYIDIGYSYKSEQINSTHSSGLYFNPTLIFSAGFGKRAPYGKFGIIAASPKVKTNEYSYDDGDGIYETNTKWEYSGGLAIGYQAAVGINWQITERLDIYTEADFVSMTYYAKEGNMTEYIVNGVDQLEQLILNERKIEYKKKFDPSVPWDANKPQVMLREASPFSYISAQVGIRFTIVNLSD